MSKRKRRALKRAPTGAFVAVALAVALSTLVVAALAEEPHEEPTPMRLTYEVDPGLHTCPDEKRFRAVVAKRFYSHRQPPLPDPFRDGLSAQRLDVEVSHSEQHYEVLLVLFDAAGNKLGYSDPPLRALRCDAAVNQAAGLAAMWLWPLAPPAPLPTPAPPAVTPAAPEVPAAKPPEPPSPQGLPPPNALPPAPLPKSSPAPERPRFLRAGFMVGVDVRPVTLPAFGLIGDVGFKVERYTLAAQFHAVPVATASAASAGGLKTTLLTGGLVACLRLDLPIPKLPVVVPLCVLGEVGGVQLLVPVSGSATRVFAAGGGRIGGEIPLGSGVYVSLTGDLLWASQPSLVNSSLLPGKPPPDTARVTGAAGGGSVGVGVSF